MQLNSSYSLKALNPGVLPEEQRRLHLLLLHWALQRGIWGLRQNPLVEQRGQAPWLGGSGCEWGPEGC